MINLTKKIVVVLGSCALSAAGLAQQGAPFAPPGAGQQLTQPWPNAMPQQQFPGAPGNPQMMGMPQQQMGMQQMPQGGGFVPPGMYGPTGPMPGAMPQQVVGEQSPLARNGIIQCPDGRVIDTRMLPAMAQDGSGSGMHRGY